MTKKTTCSLFVLVFLVWGVNKSFAYGDDDSSKRKNELAGEMMPTDTLKWSMRYLQNVFYSDEEWYITDKAYWKSIKGVLNYAENEPIDTAAVDVRKLLSDHGVVYVFDRRPQDIRNREEVPGYIMPEAMEKELRELNQLVTDSLNRSVIVVPEELLSEIDQKVELVPDLKPERLMAPDAKVPGKFRSMLNNSFNKLQLPDSIAPVALDSIRNFVVDSCRLVYNDSLMRSYRDSVIFEYRADYIKSYSDSLVDARQIEIEDQNFDALAFYNDSVVEVVNDSIRYALDYLTAHAEADSSYFTLSNLDDDQYSLWTADRNMRGVRIYLKNEQNDSLGIIVRNQGKGNVKMIIDDGVTFTRFSESQRRETTIRRLETPTTLREMEKRVPKLSPWKNGGNGTLGFTQTSLTNWAPGGESNMQLLAVATYFLNYSKDKMKWENNVEFRYGLNKTESKGLEKNDDRIEINSRFGYSAGKKWYYSGEVNFRTQIAKGYKNDKVISKFMAPGYLSIAAGMDYKPNADFSLFLSPLTMRTTYVNDTTLSTNYGLKEGQKRSVEPGYIIKANFSKKLHENIQYQTKGDLFSNYKNPFSRFVFNWEQTLIMQVTQYINARIMTHLVYDENVKFNVYDSNGDPVLDDEGNAVKKAKWQFKELFTIGFTYKF